MKRHNCSVVPTVVFITVLSYSIVTGVQVPITTKFHDQWGPYISGNRIVWTDYRNGEQNEDIYIYTPDCPSSLIYGNSSATTETLRTLRDNVLSKTA